MFILFTNRFLSTITGSVSPQRGEDMILSWWCLMG